MFMKTRNKWQMILAGVIATSIFVAPAVHASNYIVQKGDTLTKIAKTHNTTINQLRNWNKIKGDSIYVAQKLVVSNKSVESAKTTTPVKKTTPAKTTTAPVKKTTTVKTTTPVKTKTVKQSSTNVAQVTKNTTETTTYKVVQGDTLTKIANKYNVPVANIKESNSLENDIIYIGQSLKVTAADATQVNGSPTDTTTNGVVTGDSNITVSAEEIGKQQIAKAEALITKQLAQEKAVSKAPNNQGQAVYNKAIDIAKSLIGTPYIFGGNSIDGFDCSGFVQYVYSAAGLNVTRLDSESYFMKGSTKVTTPVPGDVIFFKNTYKAGISHMGIYIGDGQFIHAGSDGVEISKLQYNYWDSRFVAFKRLNQVIQ